MKAFEIKNIWLQKFIIKVTHIADTWKGAEKYFAPPRVFCKIGLWKNDTCLPVWRHGLVLYLSKKIYNISYINIRLKDSKRPWYKAYYVHSTQRIKDGVTYITDHNGEKKEILKYKSVTHKLPGNLMPYDIVWRRDIRKKLKKWKLDWIKPVIYLPMWTAFYYMNSDIFYKTKWTASDFRFEYPGQWTIVFFGISISFWSKAPYAESNGFDDFYWESILSFKYNNDFNIYRTIEEQNYIIDENKNKTLTINEAYLTDEGINFLDEFKRLNNI